MTAPERLSVVLAVAADPHGLRGGFIGGCAGLTAGLLTLVVPWYRQPLWVWAALYLRRRRGIVLLPPSTAVNDRSAGGVRYQDGVATVAVHILGRAYAPNTVDRIELGPHNQRPRRRSIDSATGSEPRAKLDSISTSAPDIAPTAAITPRCTTPDRHATVCRGKRNVAGRAHAGPSQRRRTRIAQQRRRRGRCRGPTHHSRSTASGITRTSGQRHRNARIQRNVAGSSSTPTTEWRSVRTDAGWLTTYAYRPEEHHHRSAVAGLDASALTPSHPTSPSSRQHRHRHTHRAKRPAPAEPPNSRLLTLPVSRPVRPRRPCAPHGHACAESHDPGFRIRSSYPSGRPEFSSAKPKGPNVFYR